MLWVCYFLILFFLIEVRNIYFFYTYIYKYIKNTFKKTLKRLFFLLVDTHLDDYLFWGVGVFFTIKLKEVFSKISQGVLLGKKICRFQSLLFKASSLKTFSVRKDCTTKACKSMPTIFITVMNRNHGPRCTFLHTGLDFCYCFQLDQLNTFIFIRSRKNTMAQARLTKCFVSCLSHLGACTATEKSTKILPFLHSRKALWGKREAQEVQARGQD